MKTRPALPSDSLSFFFLLSAHFDRLGCLPIENDVESSSRYIDQLRWSVVARLCRFYGLGTNCFRLPSFSFGFLLCCVGFFLFGQVKPSWPRRTVVGFLFCRYCYFHLGFLLTELSFMDCTRERCGYRVSFPTGFTVLQVRCCLTRFHT